MHPKAAETFWCHGLYGLTIEQTAEVLDVRPRTVCRHWNYARAWLRQDLDRSR